MIELAPVRQSVSEQQVDNVPAAVWNGLNALPLSGRVRPGMRVAVAVGSRGISCYAQVVRAVVEMLQSLGAEPFLVPAMGSHGGGTAEGQRAVLDGYGMAELGVPIHSSLEVKQIGEAGRYADLLGPARGRGRRRHPHQSCQGPHCVPRRPRERSLQNHDDRPGQEARRGDTPRARRLQRDPAGRAGHPGQDAGHGRCRHCRERPPRARANRRVAGRTNLSGGAAAVAAGKERCSRASPSTLWTC